MKNKLTQSKTLKPKLRNLKRGEGVWGIREEERDEDIPHLQLLKTLLSVEREVILRFIQYTQDYDLLDREQRKILLQFYDRRAEGFEDAPETRERFERLSGYDGLILYKMHGSFLDRLDSEKLPPIIVTEDDYIQLLTVVGGKDIGVPRPILRRIIPSTLLFLGYSLEDWDFRTIYKGLIERLP